jgi:hypothetical protein
MEPNGRNFGNPWSLRQCGLYHQLQCRQLTSCWIGIFNQGEMYETLKSELPAYSGRPNGGCVTLHPLDAHVALFQQLCSFHWDDYISDLGKEIALIVMVILLSLEGLLTFRTVLASICIVLLTRSFTKVP